MQHPGRAVGYRRWPHPSTHPYAFPLPSPCHSGVQHSNAQAPRQGRNILLALALALVWGSGKGEIWALSPHWCHSCTCQDVEVPSMQSGPFGAVSVEPWAQSDRHCRGKGCPKVPSRVPRCCRGAVGRIGLTPPPSCRGQQGQEGGKVATC